MTKSRNVFVRGRIADERRAEQLFYDEAIKGVFVFICVAAACVAAVHFAPVIAPYFE